MRIFMTTITMLLAMPAWAANCYICGAGSSDACKNYCQYAGEDNYKARKRCQSAGCKVSGAATCPTAVNYKTCFVGEIGKQPAQNLARHR